MRYKLKKYHLLDSKYIYKTESNPTNILIFQTGQKLLV